MKKKINYNNQITKDKQILKCNFAKKCTFECEKGLE